MVRVVRVLGDQSSSWSPSEICTAFVATDEMNTEGSAEFGVTSVDMSEFSSVGYPVLGT